MTNIRINTTNRTIEVTKAFANKANRFGTDEYKELREARNDFPGFKVVTKSTGKKTGTFKGLTIKYMREYIESHDNENKETIAEFNILCGLDEKGEKTDFAATASYGEIKKWFLGKYPVFNDYTKKVNEVLKKSA